MAEIILESLASARFGEVRLGEVNLRLRDGEVLVLVGPDPAVASLLLDIVAGRERSNSGSVLVDGVPLDALPAHEAPQLIRPATRSVLPAGTVMAALQDVAAGLQAPDKDPLDIARLLGLGEFLDQSVAALAEADQRRLAIAVQILQRSHAILLDQTTLGLGASERERLGMDVGAALTDVGATALYATTDADDALRVGDRLAYISHGQIQQVGTPAQLLADPVSLDVARYLAGTRLPSAQARVSERHVVLPEGRIRRPAHVPPPDAGRSEVVYAAWPRSAELERIAKQRAVDEQPAVPVGQAAEPAMVFDPQTGSRLDRAGGAPTRSVNVLVGGSRGKVLPRSETLEPSARYRLIVWIGARDERSIVSNASEHAFPDALLPPSTAGHVLQVVAHSADLEVARSSHELVLPAHGDSRRISIGFRTPADPGTGTIRLVFYYQQHVLQSALINVSWRAGSAKPPAGYIDYTVSDLDDVARLPERDLSLVVNETSADRHLIIVNGRKDPDFGVVLYEKQMTTRLATARQALLAAHRDPETDASRYDPRDNTKPREEFITDLTNLAHRGASLLEVLIPNMRRRNKLIRRLREASTERDGQALVQIAYAAGSRLDFPWHLVYDIGLGVFTKRVEKPCPVLELWHPHADPAELPPLCPYREKHKENTICPYGFWGFAHILEIPPSTPDPSSSLPLCVRNGELSAKMIVGLSRQLDADLTTRHLSRLPVTLQREECDSLPLLKAAMAAPERELMYFYCHGLREYTEHYGADTPLLELGDHDYIASGDVISWASLEGDWPPDHWEATQPLVVINGCHTAEVTPVQAADFVSAFVDVGAAGVVGTEIMISQPVASEAAELLLGGLLADGATVGAALRSMRRGLLAKGNVMGLAYTAYCSASLALRCQPH